MFLWTLRPVSCFVLQKLCIALGDISFSSYTVPLLCQHLFKEINSMSQTAISILWASRPHCLQMFRYIIYTFATRGTYSLLAELYWRKVNLELEHIHFCHSIQKRADFWFAASFKILRKVTIQKAVCNCDFNTVTESYLPWNVTLNFDKNYCNIALALAYHFCELYRWVQIWPHWKSGIKIYCNLFWA